MAERPQPGRSATARYHVPNRRPTRQAGCIFKFILDAGVPGFSVSDRYRSEASPEFCSGEFLRTTKHGSKKIDEKITFDQQHGTATPRDAVGGKTELKISASPAHATRWTFLYYVRRELSQGRIPPTQTVFLGAQYDIRVEFVRHAEHSAWPTNAVEADRVTASAKGPPSDISFEVFFLKDRSAHPRSGARSAGAGHVLDGAGADKFALFAIICANSARFLFSPAARPERYRRLLRGFAGRTRQARGAWKFFFQARPFRSRPLRRRALSDRQQCRSRFLLRDRARASRRGR